MCSLNIAASAVLMFVASACLGNCFPVRLQFLFTCTSLFIAGHAQRCVGAVDSVDVFVFATNHFLSFPELLTGSMPKSQVQILHTPSTPPEKRSAQQPMATALSHKHSLDVCWSRHPLVFEHCHITTIQLTCDHPKFLKVLRRWRHSDT